MLISLLGFSQENNILLNGKVKSLKNDVSSVLIVNLNSRKSTITDSLGLFTIEVKLRDSLKISAVQYQTKTISITDSILLKRALLVNLIDNVIKLKEVTVMPYNLTGKIETDIERLNIKPTVTSTSLGLPNADVEIMTQSEQLLQEADRGKFIRYAVLKEYGLVNEIISYATVPIQINTHKILNRVSGRTKSLKERVSHDEKIELEQEIITKFSKKTIAEDFDIPEVNVDAFLTYCMSQKDFSELSQAQNSVELWEYLKANSITFKKQPY